MSRITPDDRIHELLPWYATGTLEAAETDVFRRHLDDCAVCRDELVVLEDLQREVRLHGEAFFEEHPSAERLVAGVRGEVSEAEAAPLRRHLALCASCAVEARWVSGEAVAGADSAPRRAESSTVVAPGRNWALVAAAIVAFVAVVATPAWFVLRDGAAPSRAARPHLIQAAERAEGRNLVQPSPGRSPISLFFEIDLPRTDFPCTVEMLNDDGATVLRLPDIGHGTLLDGFFLLQCARRDCRPGRYTVNVYARGQESPEIVFDLEIAQTPDDGG